MNDDELLAQDQNETDADGGDPIPSTPADEDAPIFPEIDGADTADTDGGHGAPPPPPLSGDPRTDPDPDHCPASEGMAQERLAELRDELTKLRDELTAERNLRADLRRMASELREFQTLFPDVPLSELPDEVTDGMCAGIPPAAGYALFLRRQRERERQAKSVNDANRLRSSGSLTTADADYFSPAEVRAMSPSDVRKNYQKIMQSMQKWH